MNEQPERINGCMFTAHGDILVPLIKIDGKWQLELVKDERDTEIARLRAIVDKLPKTADGVDATTIDEVWICDEFRHGKQAEPRYGSIEMECVGVWNGVFNCEYEGHDRYPVSQCYSTRAAAESAREAKP